MDQSQTESATVERRLLSTALWVGAIDSPIGRLVLTTDEEALVSIQLPGRRDLVSFNAAEEENPILHEAKAQLEAYFQGRLRSFDLPLRPKGTEFQRMVWAAVGAIRFGKTRSYAEIAADIGRPSASRAVGAANGQNPLPLVIPCHRVVGGQGKLVGYAGGLEAKAWLLHHERAITIGPGLSLGFDALGS